MKRLNPNTGLLFKYGDLREDGCVFVGYKLSRLKKNGFFAEQWSSKDSFSVAKVGRALTSKKCNDRNMSTKEGHMKILLKNIKVRAKQQNLPFNITLAYLNTLPSEVCPVFNTLLSWSSRSVTTTSQSPSLDRIDPSLGYIIGNVEWLSHKANAMKQNATPEQLKQFAKWVIQQHPNLDCEDADKPKT